MLVNNLTSDTSVFALNVSLGIWVGDGGKPNRYVNFTIVTAHFEWREN